MYFVTVSWHTKTVIFWQWERRLTTDGAEYWEPVPHSHPVQVLR
jgi:hypothetical protein